MTSVEHDMDEHYFSEKPKSELVREHFSVPILGHSLEINSGSGIFSLKYMDSGTKLLIENAKPTLQTHDVLDLGCGYGIVGIALKKAYPKINIVMSDINERALKFTRENCKANDIDADIIKSDIFSNPNLNSKTFDMILTNPPFSSGKEVCKQFIEQSQKHLRLNGLFLLVAPHRKGGLSLKSHMLSAFGNVGELSKKSGYRVYISVKK